MPPHKCAFDRIKYIEEWIRGELFDLNVVEPNISMLQYKSIDSFLEESDV